MHTPTDNVEEKIRSGNYDINLLETYIDKLITLSHHGNYSAIRADIMKTFSSFESCKRLAELVFTQPDNIYSILARLEKTLYHSGTVLLKAYIGSSLLNRSYWSLSIYPDHLVRLLIDFHPYNSLYNPLVLIFIGLKSPATYLDKIIRPVYVRNVIYEFNPNIPNTVLYRDLLIHVGLMMDRDVVDTLYDFSTAFKDSLYDEASKLYNEYNAQIIVGSYLRVLKGVLETIRSIPRGLEKYKQINNVIESSYSNTFYQETFNRIYESYRKSCLKSLNDLHAILRSLIAPGFENVYKSILKTAEVFYSKEYNVKPLAYDTLTLLIETKLFIDYFSTHDYPINEDKGEVLKAIEEFSKTISSVLEQHKGIVIELLSYETEPYITLRKRLALLRDHGYLSWLVL